MASVYFNNQIVEEKDVVLSYQDRGFLFSDGVYEVIRFLDGKLLFMDLHIQRLKRSINELKINFLNYDDILVNTKNLILKNNFENENGIIYIQITRGVQTKRMHHYGAEKIAPTVLITASIFNSNPLNFTEGIKVITVSDNRWARCDIKTISLLPNSMAAQLAFENNCLEAIFIKDGMITEGSKSNFFAIKKDVIYTHPSNNNILNGITRVLIIELIKKLGLKLNEFPISENDIKNLDEAFITSTTSDITPVVEINNKNVGTGKVGKITLLLQKEFNMLIKNLLKK